MIGVGSRVKITKSGSVYYGLTGEVIMSVVPEGWIVKCDMGGFRAVVRWEEVVAI